MSCNSDITRFNDRRFAKKKQYIAQLVENDATPSNESVAFPKLVKFSKKYTIAGITKNNSIEITYRIFMHFFIENDLPVSIKSKYLKNIRFPCKTNIVLLFHFIFSFLFCC